MRHTRLYRDGVLEAKDFPAAQISDYLQQPGTVVWLDLCEPDQQDLAVVSQEFGLHPLAVEDATQEHERPKLDRYQDHYFLTAYAVSLDPTGGRLQKSELAAFITPRALITVRKDAGFDIDGVVERWDGSADLGGHHRGADRGDWLLRHERPLPRIRPALWRGDLDPAAGGAVRWPVPALQTPGLALRAAVGGAGTIRDPTPIPA